MTPEQFWHDDLRLLEVYQKAYLRHTSYMAWLNGQYDNIAFSVVMANAFAKKGSNRAEYPKWQDPINVIQKPKITKNNIEQEFRNLQLNQTNWLKSRYSKKE
jgi:hypothetical protein